MIDHIQWLGHGSFRIQGSPLIYINPWRVSRDAPPADAILVSDDDYNHCSLTDVERIQTPATMVVTNARGAAVLGGSPVVLRPWQCVNIAPARVSAVPSYTFSGNNPASKDGLGFLISYDRCDIFYAGCTDLIPELDTVHCDIAILPLSVGNGALDLDRTVALVDRLRPSYVVPSHWGTLSRTHLDVQVLARALEGRSKVVMLEKAR